MKDQLSVESKQQSTNVYENGHRRGGILSVLEIPGRRQFQNSTGGIKSGAGPGIGILQDRIVEFHMTSNNNMGQVWLVGRLSRRVEAHVI